MGMEAEFGWRVKKEELWSNHAWYMLARTEEGRAVAFSHFRYDINCDDEVLYCYEIQVEEGFRRKGLGRFMMKVLEMLCLKADMLKLMVTIFKKDVPQAEFFKKALKFEKDETGFAHTVNEQFKYEILCRFNQIKKRRKGSPSEGKHLQKSAPIQIVAQLGQGAAEVKHRAVCSCIHKSLLPCVKDYCKTLTA